VTRPLFSRDEKRLALVVVGTLAGSVLQQAVAVPRALLAAPMALLEASWATAATSLAQVAPLVVLAWAALATYGVWSMTR